MYIDKRLADVQAVQTLSRLNRTYPGKTDTFVLDFVNRAEEIQAAFQPFYEQTMVEEVADHHQLYDLMYKLADARVYTDEDIKAFAKAFFNPKYSATTHGRLNLSVAPGLARFNTLEEPKQSEFRNQLKAFVRLYAFMSHIMPFPDIDLEELYTYGRFLLTKLPRPGAGAALHLDDEVQLRYYRIEKISEGSIGLFAGEGGTVRGPTDVGTMTARDERARLSEIVETLNERFGTAFTRVDQLFFDQVKEEAKVDDDIVEQAQANAFDNFLVSSSLRKRIMDLMVERNDQNAAIVAKYMDEDDFQKLAFRLLAKQIYDEIRGDG
jgi:type I restriction enzyme R subunit